MKPKYAKNLNKEDKAIVERALELSMKGIDSPLIGKWANILDPRGLGGWWQIYKVDYENNKIICVMNNLYTDWEDILVSFNISQISKVADSPPAPIKKSNAKQKKAIEEANKKRANKILHKLRESQNSSYLIPPDHPIHITGNYSLAINPILDIMGKYHGDEYASTADVLGVGVPKTMLNYYLYYVPDTHPNKLRPDKIEKIPYIDPKTVKSKDIVAGRRLAKYEVKQEDEDKIPLYETSPMIRYRILFKWRKIWFWYYNRKSSVNSIFAVNPTDLEKMLETKS